MRGGAVMPFTTVDAAVAEVCEAHRTLPGAPITLGEQCVMVPFGAVVVVRFKELPSSLIVHEALRTGIIRALDCKLGDCTILPIDTVSFNQELDEETREMVTKVYVRISLRRLGEMQPCPS